MPPQAGEMKFVIETDEKGSIIKVRQLKNETTGLGKESEKTKTKYGNLIGKIAAGATVLVAARKGYQLVKESIGLASDAMEANSKLGVVFEGQLDKVSDAVKNLNDNYGFSVTAAEKLMGNTGDLLAGLGFQDKVVFDLSEKVQKLAGDTASFSNVQGGAEFASRALTSMLLGEKEMAKQLGIVINENDKSFKSQVKTLVEVEGMTLVQAKALVRLQEAYKQSENSIGDFSRTQDSFANQTKILNNTLEDLKVEFGKVFVEVLLPLLRDFSGWVKENKDFIADSFRSIGKAAEFALGPVKALAMVSELFKQNREEMERAAQQADDISANFSRLEAAIRQAGIKTSELNKAIMKTPGAERIKELRDNISKYNDAMARASHSGAAVSRMEEKIAKAQSEINSIRMESIQAIFKTSGAYGIEAEKINAVRAAIQEHIKKADEFQKKRAENTEKSTAEIKKIIPWYDEALKKLKNITGRALLAWETLEGLRSDELIKKQNDFQSTLQGTDKQLEALGITGQWALDNIANRSGALEIEIISLTRSFTEFIGIANGAVRAILSIDGAMDGLSERTKDTIDVFGNLIGDLASGNYIGAIMGVVGSMDKLANSLWGISDAGPTFEERVNAASQELSGIAGISDLAAVNLANFHKAVEEGKYELDEYADFLRETNAGLQAMQESQYQFWGALSGGDMDEFNSSLDDYQAYLNEIAGMDAGAIFESMSKAIDPLNDFLSQGARGQMEFNDQVNITMGVFSQLVRSGESIVSVLSMMGDSFDILAETQKNSGLESSKVFEQLSEFRKLIKDNEDLVKSVEGFNDVLKLQAGLGKIPQEQLTSYARQASREFEKLTQAGFSNNQAMQLMAPSLKELEENSKRYGTTIDKNTQSLIDQAREAGMFENLADPMDTLLDVMVRIGEAMGATFEGIDGIGQSASTAGEKSGAAMDELSVKIGGVGLASMDAASIMTSGLSAATDEILKTGEASMSAAQMMSDSFQESADISKAAVEGFTAYAQSKLSEFNDLGKIGLNINNNNNINTTQPAPLAIPRFANGTPPGGRIVPPGFNDDNYFIGLKSGERFTVDNGRNQTQTPPVVIERLNVTVVAAPGDSVEELSNKFIQALRNDTIGLVREMNRAGVGKNG